MSASQTTRPLILGLAVAALSFWNFSNLTGGDCIRAIHIVSLLVCGAGLGVALTALFSIIRNKG